MTQKACQLGQTFYDEAARKCRRCKCRKGFEFSMKTIYKIPFDDHYGALGCPVCIKCTNGFYSSRRTGYECIKCSTPCKELKKETLISCNGRRNNKCGACLPGYYSQHPQLSSFPCKACSHTNNDRRECQGYTTALPKLIQTVSSKRVVIYGTSPFPPAEMNNANMKEVSRQWKWTPFIVSATVAICGVTVVLSVMIYKKSKAVQNGRTTGTHFGSTGGQLGSTDSTGGQLGSTNSTTSKPLLPIGGTEPSVSALDVDGCAFEEGLDLKTMMEDINLQNCKSLINTISAQIDRDPEPLFRELKIEAMVMYQAREHLRDKSDVREYVYSVLSRWVETKGPVAKLSDLYEAFQKCGSNAQCSIILRYLRCIIFKVANPNSLSTSSLLLLFVCTCVTASSKCLPGISKYDAKTGTCKKCTCSSGSELDPSKPLPVDNNFGALECPPCRQCENGNFSNSNTEFNCVVCSTSCEDLDRVYLEICNGKQNNKCGQCIKGYFNPIPYLSSLPCEPCSESTRDKVECKDFLLTTAFTEKVTSIGTAAASPNDDYSLSRGTDHSPKLTTIILVLVATALLIAILLAICYLIKCMMKTSRSDGPATGDFGSSSSTSSSQKLLHQKEEPPPEEDGDLDEIPDLATLGIPDEKLKWSDCWIKIVSTKIDKEPEPLFKALDIKDHIIYQESKSHPKANGISEYVLAVLNRWVGVEGRNATLYVLYKALKDTQFDQLCKAITEDVRRR